MIARINSKYISKEFRANRASLTGITCVDFLGYSCHVHAFAYALARALRNSVYVIVRYVRF